MGLLFLVSVSASAQDNPKVDIFGGYSYLRYSPNAGTGAPSSVNFNGGVGSISYNLNNWIGGVAEVAGYHAGTINVNGTAVPGASANAVTYLFGPKIYVTKGKLTPFGQVLFGGVHGSLTESVSNVSATVSDNAFATAFGGGLDYNATRHISVRLGQIEYLMTRFSNTTGNGIGSGGTGTQNNLRYSAGVVFRF